MNPTTEQLKLWLSVESSEEENQRFLKYLATDPNAHKVLSKYIRSLKRNRYIYMLTFTLRDASNESAAVKYIKGLPNREPLKIYYMSYVRELTKAGMPHFHAAVGTKIPLKKSRLITYTKRFGFVDISKSKGKVTNFANIEDYMSKDSDITVLCDR